MPFIRLYPSILPHFSLWYLSMPDSTYYNMYLCLFIDSLSFPVKVLSVRAGALPYNLLFSRAPMPLNYFKLLEHIKYDMM